MTVSSSPAGATILSVDQVRSSDTRLRAKTDGRSFAAKYGLKTYAISNHLVGQAICDNIDERHKSISCTEDVWGDGEPEGVRKARRP